MPRVKRILVPVDFSTGAEAAFEYARFLAETFGAAIDVLHVVEPPRYSGVDLMLTVAGSTYASLPDLTRALAAREMEAFVAAHGAAAGPLRARLEVGEPATVIARLAASDAYDLVVMGTHGRTGMAHFLMGSVAENVVRRAPCPVVTVRNQDAVAN
ncbi:MAG TPA: universal stress protein [Myxococcota bacterium]|jgi:nucleotide-binding universal stress UspA family protein|nr:universal stress protein [Myxococcota bacterium]